MPRKNTDKCPSADVVTHALRVLELSDEPVAVVCRDEESRRVRTYVENCLGAPPYNGVLYVSGLPGTGKTLTIRKTLTSLQADRKLRCRTIYLNCLRLTAPGALYWEIYRRVFDDGSSSRSRAKVLNALDAHFLGGESDVSTVLVIDEADSLLGTQTRTSSMNNQEILYRLFSWSAMDTSRLVVIAIANIMDLPARLAPRVHSRLAFGNLHFDPYLPESLVAICCAQLRSVTAPEKLFHPRTIPFVAGRVYGVGGDLRRLFSVLKACLQAAPTPFRPVTPEQAAAHTKDLCSPLGAGLRGLPPAQAAFLGSLVLETQAENEKCRQVTLDRVILRLTTHLQVNDRPDLDFLQVIGVLNFLKEAGLVSVGETPYCTSSLGSNVTLYLLCPVAVIVTGLAHSQMFKTNAQLARLARECEW